MSRHLEEGGLDELLNGNPRTGERWDNVVLQEQSRLAVDMADPTMGKLGDPGAFHVSVRSLVTMIEGHDATALLYMTWAKRRFPDQTEDLARAYDGIGEELETPVAPVGLAWARATRERPDASLFNGFYDTHCYLPLLGFISIDDEPEQHLFHARLQIRMDAGFYHPLVIGVLEELKLVYAVGMAKNSILKGLAQD